MHRSFNNVEENHILLDEMIKGKGVVGVRFARSERPMQSTFFESLTAAEPTIRAILADMSVNGCWVACHVLIEDDLNKLLLEINKTRPFSAMCSLESGCKSYDLL